MILKKIVKFEKVLIMDDYNKEKYRVCLDEYQDEDGESMHTL